jgi:hypothetical protein
MFHTMVIVPNKDGMRSANTYRKNVRTYVCISATGHAATVYLARKVARYLVGSANLCLRG